MAAAVVQLLADTRAQPSEMRSVARREAARAFDAGMVCGKISSALEELVDGGRMGRRGE